MELRPACRTKGYEMVCLTEHIKSNFTVRYNGTSSVQNDYAVERASSLRSLLESSVDLSFPGENCMC